MLITLSFIYYLHFIYATLHIAVFLLLIHSCFILRSFACPIHLPKL